MDRFRKAVGKNSACRKEAYRRSAKGNGSWQHCATCLGHDTVWLSTTSSAEQKLIVCSDEAKEQREEGSDTLSQASSPRPEQREAVPVRVDSVTSTFSPLRNEATASPELDDDINGDDVFGTSQPSRPALATSHQSYAAKMGVPVQQSMFNLLSATPSPSATPTTMPGSPVSASSLSHRISNSTRELKAEVISGVEEIM
jgi:translation initiation factor eIF-2B subunit beta